MHIVQVISSLTGRGAERICIELHERFLREGHTSKIYITHNIIEHEVDTKYIEYVPPSEIVSRLTKEPYDLLLGHMTHAAKILRYLKKDRRVFFIIHTSLSAKLKKEPLKRRIVSYLKLFVVYNGSKVVSVSKWVEGDLKRRLKIFPKYSTTIYNPFDIQKIRELGNRPIELDFDFIIAVGSLHKIKRFDLLLQAYARLNTHLHLIILGNGKEESVLRSMCQELGIDKRVHFLGWVENPYPYIRSAKLLALTSDIEGLPSVVIEALILRTPVVATDCPSGIREIMEGPLRNFLATPGDISDIAEKISKALENYPGFDERLLEKFDARAVVKKYLALIKRDK
jgi:glycosyltransferase involved in cell wall biosynthesis